MTLTRAAVEELAALPVSTRPLPGGRRLWLYPMLFTMRLVIGMDGADGYDNAWCFDDPVIAMSAFLTWDPLDPATPEPEGWIKNPVTGERRSSMKGEEVEDHD